MVEPLVNPVLFNMCRYVTVECCVLYPCYVGVFGMFVVLKEKGSSPVSERRDMGVYEEPLSYLLGFGIGTMLANFHM